MAKKVLVVEDDSFISTLITTEIQKSGYEVQSAHDGPHALLSAREEKPDLILLDLLMPEMDGFQVLEKLKADTVTASIPVIVLSNFGQPEDIKRATDAGAADFLVKVNFTPTEIIEKVNAIFGQSSAKK